MADPMMLINVAFHRHQHQQKCWQVIQSKIYYKGHRHYNNDEDNHEIFAEK